MKNIMCHLCLMNILNFFEIFLRGYNYELSLAYGHETLLLLLGAPEWI